MYRYIIYILLVLALLVSLTETAISEEKTVQIVPQIATTSPTMPQVKTFDSEVHRLALKYKVNETLARKIISCEGKLYEKLGNNKNYNKQGVVWSTDWAWWQINDYYHLEPAKKMGLDIKDKWQNLEYGFWLLKTQGSSPWVASKFCWSK